MLHIETAGVGPPLVLLHGWGMHSGFWAPLLPRLTSHFQVLAVDLPGHGYSASVVAQTLAQSAATVASAVLSQVADPQPPVVVMGWSLGALIAMQWALTEPRNVSALILVAATPRFIASSDWACGMAERTLRRFGDELQLAYKPTLQRFLSLQLQASELQASEFQASDFGRRAFRNCSNGTALNRATLKGMRHELLARDEPGSDALRTGLDTLLTTDLRSRVASIRVPSLVIAGDRDALTPMAASRWLADALPQGELALIRGAGHVPFLSHPDAFMRAFDTFAHGG